MPRPAEELPKSKTWWDKTTTQERVLTIVTVISIIIIIVLLFLVARKQAGFVDNTCNSTVCLTESSRILEHINPEINPCDDFYEFSCGKFLENTHGDENLGLTNLVADEAKRELFEGYIEPINESEHEMVQFAKKIFRACMNETEIENDHLNTIKEVIRDLGGWPVVEGPSWNDRNFDWIQTTYRLRQYGYPFSVFLGLTVTVHPHNASKYILKVETPELWDYSTRHFDKIQLMTELAETFGASDKNRALQEMTKAHDFLIRLQTEIHNTYMLGAPGEYTIDRYQILCPSMKWLEFIKNVVGPTVNVSKDDQVVFPPPQTLNNWFDLISKTVKRTQANYMIWKVIETTLPYLNERLRNYGASRRAKESRDEFCLMEVQERLIPSPIDIMCDRKYLPKDRKDKIEELVTNIKSEFNESVEKIDWLDNREKQKALNFINTLKTVIGQPQDYLDDQILDNLNADMVEIKKETFLNLLIAANRNRQTMIFNQLEAAPMDNLYDKWYMKSASGLPTYAPGDNVLYIPTTSIQFLYNEERPNYLNYGALGSQIGGLLSKVISKYIPVSEYSPLHEKISRKTKHGGEEKMKCMKKLAEAKNEELEGFKADLVLQQSIGGKISYKAYETWKEINEEEKQLIGSDYTPKQLYWISQALLYCIPFNYYGQMQKLSLSGVTFISVSNNPDFANDFNCPEGSKMNPWTRCELL